MLDTFKLEIYISGNKGKGAIDLTNEVISYSIRKDIFQGCAELTADINCHRTISVARDDWGFRFLINGTQFIEGRIDTVKRKYSKGSWTMTITGRDSVQAWTDSSVLIYKTYKNPEKNISGSKWSFESIVNDVLNNSSTITDTKGKKQTLICGTVPWDLTDEAANSGVDLSSITHIATSPGDTIFSFVSGLANSLGLIIWAKGGGKILVDKLLKFEKGLVSYSLRNKDGASDNNILEGELSENIGGYHSVRRITGQANGTAYDAENPWGIAVKSNQLMTQRIDTTFPGVRKAKVVEITDSDLVAWSAKKFADSAETTRMMRNLVIAENRELFKFTYKVPGHSQIFRGKPITYELNSNVKVEDDILGISGGFLIMGLTLTGSKDEQTTSLELGYSDTTQQYSELYDNIKFGGYPNPTVVFDPVQVSK